MEVSHQFLTSFLFLFRQPDPGGTMSLFRSSPQTWQAENTWSMWFGGQSTVVHSLTVFNSATENQTLYLPLGASNSYHKQTSCPVTSLEVWRGYTWTAPCSLTESKVLGSSCPRVPFVALTWDVAVLDARWRPRLDSWGTTQVARAPPLTSSLMAQPRLRASVLKGSCGQGRTCKDR